MLFAASCATPPQPSRMPTHQPSSQPKHQLPLYFHTYNSPTSDAKQISGDEIRWMRCLMVMLAVAAGIFQRTYAHKIDDFIEKRAGIVPLEWQFDAHSNKNPPGFLSSHPDGPLSALGYRLISPRIPLSSLMLDIGSFCQRFYERALRS